MKWEQTRELSVTALPTVKETLTGGPFAIDEWGRRTASLVPSWPPMGGGMAAKDMRI